ncbi:MAG: hypothetical protein H5U40_15060, partial [Polyangiaceae bacterium]|nr:hypothetical protein [Polyangiaceae bacterium]
MVGELIQKVIDFVLTLIGLKQRVGKLASAAGSVSGLENVSGVENVRVAGGKVLAERDGASLIEDESMGRLWIDQVKKSIPREAWVDEWGPAGAGPSDDGLATFLMHEQVFSLEMQADPMAAEQKLIAFGYRDAGQFYKVRATMMKHFADYHGPNLQDCVFQSQRVMNAMMKASQMAHRANMQQAMQADPALTAPVEGVTMEQYAQLQAKSVGLSQDQHAAFLAQHGLDPATFQRIAAEWNDRMQKDTTHTLVTLYGQAFQSAGAGQFGGAAQAYAATGYDGTAAGGPEPMPFEKCCEIQGAMQAWSDTGQDVNAMLAKTFGMNAADFSAAHSWWLSQLTANLSRF